MRQGVPELTITSLSHVCLNKALHLYNKWKYIAHFFLPPVAYTRHYHIRRGHGVGVAGVGWAWE